MKILDIPKEKFPHTNESVNGEYKEHYNEKTKSIIGNIYKRDIQEFNYAF